MHLLRFLRPGLPAARRVSQGLAGAACALLLALAQGAEPATSSPQPVPAPASASAPQAEPVCPPPPAEPTPEALRQELQGARDHGLLWRLRRDGRVSWLYGTVHVGQRDWMLPGPKVMAALRASQELVLELDLADPAVVERLSQLTRQPADGTPLPPALAERLARHEAHACLGPAMAGLRPELRAATLTAVALRHEGLDPSWGVDNFLAGLARGMGKPVRALETPERQMKLLLGEDAQARAAIVTEALDELEQGQAQRTLRRLVNAWAEGDLATLAAYPQWCDCLQTPEQRRAMRRLLDERNVAMAAAVTRLHQRARGLFVAVGSLHMMGPHGLPALLKARGFEVERVRLTAGAESLLPAASAASASGAR